MRSRAQTIAIILSKFKKRSAARGAAFEALTPDQARDATMKRLADRKADMDSRRQASPDAYPFPKAARALITPWNEINGEFLIAPDGQAISGQGAAGHQTLMRTLGFVDGKDISNSAYSQAFKAGFIRGRVDAPYTNNNDNDGEKLSLDIPLHPKAQAIAQQFIKESRAESFIIDVHGPKGRGVRPRDRSFLSENKAEVSAWLRTLAEHDAKDPTSFASKTRAHAVAKKIGAQVHDDGNEVEIVAPQGRTFTRTETNSYPYPYGKDQPHRTKAAALKQALADLRGGIA